MSNKQKFLNILLQDEEFFQEIHQYMIENDWKWADLSITHSSIPDIQRLKDCVHELMFGENRIENCEYSTGGFRLVYNHYNLIVSFGHYYPAGDNVVYSREISLKTLRERKLKRLIK